MTTETNDTKLLEFPGLSGIADEENAEFIQGEELQQKAANSEAAAEREDNAAGWLTAVKHAGSMVTAMIPEATPVWTEPRLEALAEALARCDEEYGWGGVGGLLGHPLILLGFAAFPLIVGTGKAIAEAKGKQGGAPAAAANGDPMGEAAGGGPAKPEAPSYAWNAAARARATATATEVRFKA